MLHIMVFFSFFSPPYSFLFLENKNAFLQIIWKNKYIKVALVWKVLFQ